MASAIRANPEQNGSKLDTADCEPGATGVSSASHKTRNLDLEKSATAVVVTQVGGWHEANITKRNKALPVKTQAAAFCCLARNDGINQQIVRGDWVDSFAEIFLKFEVPGHTLVDLPYYWLENSPYNAFTV